MSFSPSVRMKWRFLSLQPYDSPFLPPKFCFFHLFYGWTSDVENTHIGSPSSRVYLGLLSWLSLILVCVSVPCTKHSSWFFSPFRLSLPGGGSELDNAGDGYGEPLNVIISGLSSPDVLTDDGIVNFARAIGFSEECFGLHLGGPQSANLGDGNGYVNQTIELREDYGNAGTGTCLESVIGGNHFRVFRQNGTLADSEALFLAVSQEEWVGESHNIVPNGDNLGRNALVTAAVGDTSYGGVSYSTTATNITDLLSAGSDGVNHGISQDGIVVLLTVSVQ